MHRLIFFALFATLARATLAEVTIHLVASDDASKVRFCVEGLSQESLDALRQLPAEHLTRHFKLFVNPADTEGTVPSVLGDCSLRGEQIIFQPRFGLSAGQTYLAEFLSPLTDHDRTKATFRISAATRAGTTKVDAIYPSTSELPQNVLRFYLHFSAPMQQGNVYRFIRILRENGEKLVLPFLELSEELWDRSGTRLTLLLDPGRIKRGLVPREEDGAILEVGKKYRLKVHADWPDARGLPLGSETTKEFIVKNEDFSQPNPLEWKVIIPSDFDSDPSNSTVSGKFDLKALKRSLQVVFPGNRSRVELRF